MKPYVLVGSGRLAKALLNALPKRYAPKAVVVRDLRRANSIKPLLSSDTKLFRMENCPASNGILFAIHDDAIHSVAERLAHLQPNFAWALHTAGSHSARLLAPLRDQGVQTGVWHPLQSLQPKAPKSVFKNVACRVEGAPLALKAAKQLTKILGGWSLKISSDSDESLATYHAAASIISNDFVALWESSVQLLRKSGLNAQEARQALYPLALGTLNNLHNTDSQEALTGPVARGDLQTLQAHLEALKSVNPKIGAMHLKLSEMLFELCIDHPTTDQQDIHKFLKKYLKQIYRKE